MAPLTMANLFSLSIVLLASVCYAQSSAPSATFIYSESQTPTNFVFALRADSSNGDLYFHMEAPSCNDWMSVGIGKQMEGALMFVAYASSNGSGITLSPRLSAGHSEPTYTSNFHTELVWNANTASVNGSNNVSDRGMTLDAVCHNCSSGYGGSIDFNSAAQEFIFALGPGHSLKSDSQSADLRRHTFFGIFAMDMTKASSSSEGSVPTPNGENGAWVLSNASIPSRTQNDRDYGLLGHAVVMCLAFVLVFPLGALLLRVLEKVMLHAWIQIIATGLVIIGFAAGVYVSTEYNNTKNYASAHQIIGILLFCAILVQLGLGWMHHRRYARTKQPTILGKIHLYLGPTVLIFGLINGILGFALAANKRYIVPYIIVVVAVALVYVGVRLTSYFCGVGRRKAANGEVESFAMPAFGRGQDEPRYHQQAFGTQDPPAYGSGSYGSGPYGSGSYGSGSYGHGDRSSERDVAPTGSGQQYPRPMV